MCVNHGIAPFIDSRSLRCSFQYLKELFFIFLRPSIQPLVPPSLKAGAKVKLIFQPPNFYQVFLKLFFRGFPKPICPVSRLSFSRRLPSLSKAGAKIRQLISIFQIFQNLFLFFFQYHRYQSVEKSLERVPNGPTPRDKRDFTVQATLFPGNHGK